MPLTTKWAYMDWSSFEMLLFCIICMAKYTAQLAMVTRNAVFNTCALLDRSRSEYMATSPATNCTMINSYWYFTAAAQMSTIVA